MYSSKVLFGLSKIWEYFLKQSNIPDIKNRSHLLDVRMFQATGFNVGGALPLPLWHL